jgi:ferric-dicitrate binding protein FerR (iron transport regulator)
VRSNRSRVVRLSAAAALLLAAGSSGLWFARERDSAPRVVQANSREAVRGAFERVVLRSNRDFKVRSLPDGSRIRLGPNSRLGYDSDFGTVSRNIDLDGEAYFEVVSAAHPFVVSGKHARVRAVGTRFSVVSRPSSNYLQVAVLRGAVQVSTPEGDQRYELAAGQLLNGDNRRLYRPRPGDPALLARREAGDWVFEGVTLRVVVAELERHFGARIRLDGVAPSRRVTMALPRTSLSAALSALATATGIWFELPRAGDDAVHLYDRLPVSR